MKLRTMLSVGAIGLLACTFVSIMLAGKPGYSSSRLAGRVVPLTDEKKIELELSRLEQLFRGGKAEEILHRLTFSGPNRMASRESDGICLTLKDLLGEYEEDPREKPALDITVKEVAVSGASAAAVITVRAVKKIGDDRWIAGEQNLELELSKEGRSWRIHGSLELVELAMSWKQALDSAMAP